MKISFFLLGLMKFGDLKGIVFIKMYLHILLVFLSEPYFVQFTQELVSDLVTELVTELN